MLLALPTTQLVLMLLSFAGMLGFAGVAAWLWIRQRRAPQPTAWPRPTANTEPAAAPKPAAAPEPEPTPKPEPSEVTEFVALPGLREDDTPQRHAPKSRNVRPIEDEPERTEFIPAPLEHTGRRAPLPEPELERTEFIPAPLEHTGRRAPLPEPEPKSERTEFVPAPLEHTGRRSPLPEPEPERTEFVPAPSERTEDLEPPERTEIMAPVALETLRGRTDRLSRSAIAKLDRTAFVAPPAPAPEPERRPELSPPPPESSPAPTLAVDAPELRPAPAGPPPVDPTHAGLVEHFELAAAAYEALERGDDEDGSAALLDGHVEVLSSAPIDALLAISRPILTGPGPADPRAATAWLALLQHKTWPTRRALPELLAELDEQPRREGLRALASWDDPRAPGLAAAGLERSTGGPHYREWLALFSERGWDPGEAVVEAALDSDEPTILALGLRLAGARGPGPLAARVTAQLFAGDPRVRIEAIEAALTLGDHSAWLICRQLARNPVFPRAAELVGLLGSPSEVEQLARAVSTDAGGSPPLLWALGLSGRPRALEVCAAALDDELLRSAAADALELASGRRFDAPEDAREWLANLGAERLIAGAPRTLATLSRTLAGPSSPALRRALTRELRIRSGGALLLSPELRPRSWRASLARIPEHAIDLDLYFPWQGLRANTTTS